MRIRAESTNTHNCNDRILVRLGTTTTSHHEITLCGNHNRRTWDYVTDFVVLEWTTDGDGHHGRGIWGYVQRLD